MMKKQKRNNEDNRGVAIYARKSRIITPAVKDRKVPSGGKSRRREADDAAIFA